MGRLIVIMIFASLSGLVHAYETWVSIEDGIGAIFPKAPTRLDVEVSSGQSHAFQHMSVEKGGVVIYTIKRLPIGVGITDKNYRKYLQIIFNQSKQLMGASTFGWSSQWTSFGGARDKLDYSYSAVADGIHIVSVGFLIFKDGKVFDVDVKYSENISNHGAVVARKFLGSVMLF